LFPERSMLTATASSTLVVPNWLVPSPV
jgi:hypothetical protein